MTDSKATLESALNSFELGGRNLTQEDRQSLRGTKVLAPFVNVKDLERIMRIIRLRQGSEYENGLYNLFQTLVNSTQGDTPLFTPDDNSLVALELGLRPKVGGGEQCVYSILHFEDVKTVPFSRYPYDSNPRRLGLLEKIGGELVYQFDATHEVNVRDIKKPYKNLLELTVNVDLDRYFQDGADFGKTNDGDLFSYEKIPDAIRRFGEVNVMRYLREHLPEILRVHGNVSWFDYDGKTMKTFEHLAQLYESGRPVKIHLPPQGRTITVKK